MSLRRCYCMVILLGKKEHNAVANLRIECGDYWTLGLPGAHSKDNNFRFLLTKKRPTPLGV